MIWLTNHKPTEEQLKQIKVIKYLKNIDLWSKIPPDYTPDKVEEYLQPIIKEIKELRNNNIIIGGELTAIMIIIKNFSNRTFFTATTERKSTEVALEDGRVIKKNVFKHVQFRKIYPL